MALVVVVHFVHVLLVIGLLVLILWIFEALFEGVLNIWPVEVTGLEGLVVTLRETLVDLFVVMLVAIMIAVIAMVTTIAFRVVALTI
jgi:hypothetical protein